MQDFNFTDVYFVENNMRSSRKNTHTLTSMNVVDNMTIDLIWSLVKICRLLLCAVNNRTRERNYFRLCNQLLEKEISDEEFEAKINNNEDDYVLSNNIEADSDDVALARMLSNYLKDVNDMDDLADVFSFSYNSVNKCIIAVTNE